MYYDYVNLPVVLITLCPEMVLRFKCTGIIFSDRLQADLGEMPCTMIMEICLLR